MKHTPGPWKILKGHTGYTWFVVYKTLETNQRAEAAKVYKGPVLVKSDDGEGTALASINSTSLNHSQNKDENLTEAEANARLISAAPELWAALDFIREDTMKQGGTMLSMAASDVLCAALRKAAGK